jgi:signal transduction histidine kinase
VDMGRGLSVEQNSAALSIHESGLRRKLDSVAHEEVCRVIRESVLNAYRHASASRVEVRILYEPSRLCIHVCDDGVGLPANQSTAQSEGHWGMQGMRERACELGARLRWRSEPGKGTEVELNVPARVAYRLAVGQRKPWPIMSRLRVRHA